MMESEKDTIRSSIENDIHFRIQSKFRRGRDPHGHGMVWGAFVCLVGIILLLDHLGYVSADRLWRFWPLFIIFAGVNAFTQAGRRVWGSALIVVGVLFQLDSLGIIRFRWVDLWPLAIIAAGLAMIWGSIEARRVRDSVPADPRNATNISAVFGGIERRITAHDFHGGSVSCVFGGAELDFRDADMEGEEAVLEVNAVFGGAEIRVPESWRVEVRGQTLFGGYSDQTRSPAASDPNAAKRKTLILTGTTLFGGVEVKN